jgi:hypothetical protein
VACESQGSEAVGGYGPLRHVPGHREGPRILAGERKDPSLTPQSEILTTKAPRHHRPYYGLRRAGRSVEKALEISQPSSAFGLH